MYYLFFDKLKMELLHICYSSDEYSCFMASDPDFGIGSDVVIFKVKPGRLFTLLKNDCSN